ncbi:divalent-cation tolerance protein CutA [Candidatus Woesearchaeota archaeon]|jgi:periplasmic divalent cation tolerance protein|nr:divalent-cation tolerance protein CutA [Candidatus Woesearchaeota archaeon]
MNLKIVSTCIDDESKAEEIMKLLLEEKLAACINWWPVNSRFVWKGEIERGKEITLWIKTNEDSVEKVVEKIKSLHSYDLPVIEVFDVEQINEEAKEWLKESLK